MNRCTTRPGSRDPPGCRAQRGAPQGPCTTGRTAGTGQPRGASPQSGTGTPANAEGACARRLERRLGFIPPPSPAMADPSTRQNRTPRSSATPTTSVPSPSVDFVTSRIHDAVSQNPQDPIVRSVFAGIGAMPWA
jgi:hypothetical protein